MTDTKTIPIRAAGPRPDAHEHGWGVESRHRTSDGTVLYVRCTGCGARRVDLQESTGMPPAALSAVAPVRASR